jgi:hypothetical protein
MSYVICMNSQAGEETKRGRDIERKLRRMELQSVNYETTIAALHQQLLTVAIQMHDYWLT